MKKILLTVLVGLFVLGMSASAMAVTILPAPSTGALAPITTIAILTKTISFTGADGFFSGTLTQKVYKESAGMLFTYQFTNDAGSTDPIDELTTTDFTGFTVDIDVEEALVWNMRRNTPSTVGFQRTPGIGGYDGPAVTSALMWIQTNAKSYKVGHTTLQNGDVVRMETYAPATPEPSSMLLLGMGILGLFGLGKKKS
jgi:hypothetical protein